MAIFELTLALLLGAVLLTGVSRRIHAPYPVLLALAGAALAFVPNAPEIHIEPDLVLALFIAPILVDSGFDTAPRELRRNFLPLTSLVLVAVLVTTTAVAAFAHLAWGLPLAAAVALGAIVAPPDASAAAAILNGVPLPRRVRQILDGESLLNDATAILIYRLAVIAAVETVTFAEAGPLIALAALGSPVAGYVAGRLYILSTRRVRDPASNTVLTFVGVFGVWLGAERAGLSPIVTMVVYAMTLANTGAAQASPRNRISSYATWETVVFTLNVLAFVLMGLQARPILARLSGDGLGEALAFSGAVLTIVILTRVAYVLSYSGAVQLKNRLFGVDLAPGIQPPTFASSFVVSWSGMRGLVTLATAIALPPAFPQRDLIVLAAFVVVLGTLVIQGMTLKPLVAALRFDEDYSVEEEVSRARQTMVEAALRSLDGQLAPEIVQMREILEGQLMIARDRCEPQAATALDQLRLRLTPIQRAALNDLRTRGDISDEAYHRLEEDLDWAELDATPHGGFAPLTSSGA